METFQIFELPFEGCFEVALHGDDGAAVVEPADRMPRAEFVYAALRRRRQWRRLFGRRRWRTANSVELRLDQLALSLLESFGEIGGRQAMS